MEKYELVKKQIESYADEVEYFSHVDLTLLEDFEQKLQMKINGSYRQFLLDFGFLSFGAFEVFGIPHTKITEQNEDCTNALVNTFDSRNEINLADNLLVIHNFGNGELYCLDLAHTIPKVVAIWDEVPEDTKNPPITEIIANSFEDFLETYITMEINDFD